MLIVRIVIAMLLAAAAALSQVETGRIIGSVKDQSGAVIPGVKLTITNTQTGQTAEAETRVDGAYETVPLRIGSYRVAAEREGFKRALHEGIVLQIQQTVVVDFALEDRSTRLNSSHQKISYAVFCLK